jgi:hypothetical protein
MMEWFKPTGSVQIVRGSVWVELVIFHSGSHAMLVLTFSYYSVLHIIVPGESPTESMSPDFRIPSWLWFEEPA